MGQSGVMEREQMKLLKAEVRRFMLLSVALLAGSFGVLRAAWGPGYAVVWLLVAAGAAVYVFRFLWTHLHYNRSSADGAELYSNLGPANLVTMSRALLTGMLAGFFVGPWPTGWLAWAPGVLYLLVALSDFLDGFLARVTGRVTRLGEQLDMQWDSAGVLVGASLAVRYGQAPVWFLWVALARYFFLLGEWLLRRSGRSPLPLDASMIRRALAGMQMGVIGVILLPIFTPPATHVAVTLLMLPFTLHFLRDFLWVSGKIGAQPVNAGRVRWDPARFQSAARTWLPFGLRLVQIILLALLLLEERRAGFSQLGVVMVIVLALPATMLGAAGRLVALGVLLMTGFMLQSAPLNGLYWFILLNSTLVFMFGTGRYSLWKPEDWLIHHRAGEARS